MPITAEELGQQAICRALTSAGISPGDIDALFFTSITGVASPSIDARLVRRVRQETIEIVGAHRHSELERRLVELATRFRLRVVVDDCSREMSAHRFGELNS